MVQLVYLFRKAIPMPTMTKQMTKATPTMMTIATPSERQRETQVCTLDVTHKDAVNVDGENARSAMSHSDV